MDPFFLFPREIWCHVALFLPLPDKTSLASTNSHLFCILFAVPPPATILQQLITGGNLSVLQWLPFWQVCKSHLLLAASHGRLAVLQWILDRSRFPPPCMDIFKAAAARGHLPVLEWLFSTIDMQPVLLQHQSKTRRAVIAAARWGQLRVLQWLASLVGYGLRSVFRDSTVFIEAAGRGQLAVLQWLQTEYGPVKLDAYHNSIVTAASGGHCAVLTWLTMHTPLHPFSRHDWFVLRAVESAAHQGHLQALQLLVTRYNVELEYHVDLARDAVNEGHVHILQWLHVTCPSLFTGELWNVPSVLVNPCHEGHVHVLEWLLSSGTLCCTWKYNLVTAFEQAAIRQHVPVLQWLFKHLYPQADSWQKEEIKTHLLFLGMEHGLLESLAWVASTFQLGPKDGRYWQCGAFRTAVHNGRLEALQWWQHRFQLTYSDIAQDFSRLCSVAAARQRWNVEQWLKDTFT